MKVRRWPLWYAAHHTDGAPEADIPPRKGAVAAVVAAERVPLPMEAPDWRLRWTYSLTSTHCPHPEEALHA